MSETDEIELAAKLGADICLSGGAAGADVTWGSIAESIGHTVVHWSFDGHKPATTRNIYKLTEAELKEADPYLVEANKFLKRNLPVNKPWIMNLLRRNWYQVKYADAVYAVGTLNNKAIILGVDEYATYYRNQYDRFDPSRKDDYIDRMGVNGGTAWACQLYFNRWLEERKSFEGNLLSARPTDWFPPSQLVFYDQEKRKSLIWFPPSRSWTELDSIDESLIPKKVYAAIGTRKLNEHGEKFIKEIFNER